MTPAEQHLATRRAAGVFDFSFMALYEFFGLDALQGMQTRDLTTMQPGRIAYTVLLKDDGAVLIDATVWRLDAERFWLFTGKRIAVQARERSGEHAVLALQGPESGRILARLIGRDAVLGLKYFHFFSHAGITVGRLGFSGELGYELLVKRDDEARLRQTLVDFGIPPCSWEAADSLRIESGYVLFDREIDGRANPRELGLERLLEGKTKRFGLTRKLSGLEIVGGPAGNDAPEAQLTSECVSPTLGKPIGLGFVPPEVPPGTILRLAGGRAARVGALPFHDPLRRLPRGAPL